MKEMGADFLGSGNVLIAILFFLLYINHQPLTIIDQRFTINHY